MRLIFAGTPEFAAIALTALVDAGHDVVLVLTQPDRPAGRGLRLESSAVKKYSIKQKLTVEQPLTLKTEAAAGLIAAAEADAMIVAAYGLILPKNILEIPRLGCINIHASLLPRWRGAAPIQRAILAGDEKT
ncbi:MAG: methionyl-tRNA formyltransferase, partial [Burkholderiales bacterium]